MAFFDPQFGELLTSKETAELTGFTMNQLRNFRQRGNSPIHFLSDGNTSWYRKADVLAYLDIHGSKKMEYHKTGGYDPAPVTVMNVSIENREQFAQMAKITTRNAWSKWTETLTQAGVMSIVDAYQFLEDETVRLYKLKHGEDLREKHPDQNMDFFLRKNDPSAFWQGRTWATRSLARTIYNWEISDEDILNAPIGEVPPPKID
jgi:hypothetical protein